MIKYEDECVGCPPEMGCMGSACKFINVPHLYCDICKEEVDELYRDGDGIERCEKCALNTFERV